MNSLKRFNEVFLDIFRDIIHDHSKESDLRFYKTTLKGLLLINKRIIYNVFHNKIMIYKEAFKNRDENFFLTHDYSDLKQQNEDIFFKIVTRLKTCWSHLSPKTKQLVWLHFDILMILDEEIQII
jgi:hypothetical protein